VHDFDNVAHVGLVRHARRGFQWKWHEPAKGRREFPEKRHPGIRLERVAPKQGIDSRSRQRWRHLLPKAGGEMRVFAQ